MSIDWAGLVVIVRLLLMLTWYWQYLMRLYESETWHLEPWKFKLMVTLTLLLFGDLSDPQLGLLWISYHSSLSFLFFGKPRIDLKQVWWQKKKNVAEPLELHLDCLYAITGDPVHLLEKAMLSLASHISLCSILFWLFRILFASYLKHICEGFLWGKKKNKTKNATGM